MSLLVCGNITERKGMGWEEAGSDWILTQQGKACFRAERGYEAPLEKVQKNYSTKNRKAKGNKRLLNDRINLSGFS